MALMQAIMLLRASGEFHEAYSVRYATTLARAAHQTCRACSRSSTAYSRASRHALTKCGACSASLRIEAGQLTIRANQPDKMELDDGR